jgi:hypothetical protein
VKKTLLIIVTASIAFSGCMTNKAILLDAPAHFEGSPIINPSLSVTKGGFHPYMGISAGTSHDSSPLSTNNVAFESSNLGVHAGILYSPSLEERHDGGAFVSVGARGVYSLCKTDPRYSTDVVIDEETLNALTTNTSDISAEVIVRGGGIIRMSRVTLAGYMGVFGNYEGGEYRDFRSDVDGMGNCYNRSSRVWSFGSAIGIDLAFGAADKFAFGVVAEGRNYVMQSQTYEKEILAEDDDDMYFTSYTVITKEGGSQQLETLIKVEPYMDIQHMRVACAFSPNNVTLSTTYRW